LCSQLSALKLVVPNNEYLPAEESNTSQQTANTRRKWPLEKSRPPFRPIRIDLDARAASIAAIFQQADLGHCSEAGKPASAACCESW
jgi:hypothetical protein